MATKFTAEKNLHTWETKTTRPRVKPRALLNDKPDLTFPFAFEDTKGLAINTLAQTRDSQPFSRVEMISGQAPTFIIGEEPGEGGLYPGLFDFPAVRGPAKFRIISSREVVLAEYLPGDTSRTVRKLVAKILPFHRRRR